MALLKVRHNIEVAHRLLELPGKCENIHGHSMWVELKLYGGISHKGILETDAGPLDFGAVKKEFRHYLDTNYDHRLLLNERDPWAQDVYFHGEDWENGTGQKLPGLMATQGDPTTEHIALWLAEYASAMWKTDVTVSVQETHVNGAETDWTYVAD